MPRLKARSLIGPAIAVVLLYFFFRSVNFADAIRRLGGADWLLLALSMLIFPLVFVVRAVRWRYLVGLRKPGLRFGPVFSATTVGFAASMVLPGRVGEVIRPLYLARKETLPAGFCLGTIIVERAFDVVTMCLLLGGFLAARPLYGDVGWANPEGIKVLVFWGKIGVAAAVALLGVMVALYAFRSRAMKAFAVLFRPVPERLRGKALILVEELLEGLNFFRSAGSLFTYLLLSFAVWSTITFYYWVFMAAYAVRVPFFAVFPYVFLTGVGASIPTPGMAGGLDFFSKLGLVSLFGVNPDLAAGMTLVTHAAQVTMTCLMGYAILWKERVSLFQLKRMGEQPTP